MDSEKTVTTKLDISWGTLFKILLAVISIPLLYYLIDVITLLFIAIITMSALSPLVDFMHRRLRFPTALGILITYSLFISLLVLMTFVVVPPMVKQLTIFVTDLPSFTERAVRSIGFVQDSQLVLYK